jgi:hypothetical protein
MKHERRNPLAGPLITIGLMIGSVVAVGAVAHVIEVHAKPAAQAVVTDAAVRAGATR